jgi:hypothetical protein
MYFFLTRDIFDDLLMLQEYDIKYFKGKISKKRTKIKFLNYSLPNEFTGFSM